MSGRFQITVVDEKGAVMFAEAPIEIHQGDGVSYGPVTLEVTIGSAVVPVKGTVRVVWLADDETILSEVVCDG